MQELIATYVESYLLVKKFMLEVLTDKFIKKGPLPINYFQFTLILRRLLKMATNSSQTGNWLPYFQRQIIVESSITRVRSCAWMKPYSAHFRFSNP